MTGIVWTGQVVFTDSSDVGTTGVATLTLTPDIGVTNLPALVAGDPGLPPIFRNVQVNQVAAGVTPPASTWSLVTAGSPGVASVYDLVLYVNSGAAGVSGTFAISSAADLLGTLTNKYTLSYSTADSKWHVVPQMAGDIYSAVPNTGFSSYTGNAPQATLCTLNIPAQPFDWRPDVDGYVIPTGGTANTKIELAAMLLDPTTGNQVGYAPGVAGANPPPLHLHRAYGGAIGSGSYARVTAGSAVNIYLVAKQVQLTTDAWAVLAVNCVFNVKVNPIP